MGFGVWASFVGLHREWRNASNGNYDLIGGYLGATEGSRD